MWNYAEIKAQIERGLVDDGYRKLSSAGFLLALSGLSQMDYVTSWENDGDELTGVQWDEVEGWVSAAAQELITAVECGGSMGYPFAELAHREVLGNNGGSLAIGFQVRPLNAQTYLADGIIDTFASNHFTLASSGIYRVTGWAQHWVATGYRILSLYKNEPTYNYVLMGEATQDYVCNLNGVVELEAGVIYGFYVYSNVAQSNSGMGLARSQGSYEHYATLRLELIDDS